MFHHWRKEGIDRQHLGNLAALADVLGDFGACVLDLHFAAGAGHNLQGPQDGYARPDERGIGAAEAGQRDLVDEVAEDRRPDEQVVLHPAALGRGDEFPEPPPGGDHPEHNPVEVVLQEVAGVDQELGRRGQLRAEIGEHRREHRNDKDEQHVDEDDGQADDRDRVGHG